MQRRRFTTAVTGCSGLRTATRWLVLPLVALALNLAGGNKAARAADADGDLPKEEVVTLGTKDNVQILASFRPGTKGKESVPVILLHMHKGNRHDFDGLAQYLQGLGHAVIAPDLRGHGDSTEVNGETKPLSVETMPITHFKQMVADVEAVKSFLIEKNNAGELNIEKLCVVGAEMGAQVAMNWSVVDWSWPPLAIGKQGQDVKAIVLISPNYTFKNLRMTEALAFPAMRDTISFYIVMGADDPRELRESQKVYSAISRYRKDPEKPEDRSLFLDTTLETKLQGTKLLGQQSLNLEKRIAEFIDVRLVKQDYAWAFRKRALE